MNLQKRKSLKYIATAAVGTVGALMSPLALSMNSRPQNKVRNLKSGLSINHYQNQSGHTLLLKNETNADLVITKFNSPIVRTPFEDIDLRRILDQGNLRIPANTTQAINLHESGGVDRYASWKHITDPELSIAKVSSGGEVSVTGHYGRGTQTWIHTSFAEWV